MPAILTALKSLGPIFLSLVLPLLTDHMFKAGAYRLMKYYADRYSRRAEKTEDPEDNLKADALQKFIREIQVAWKIPF